jgi:hypothetical protein
MSDDHIEIPLGSHAICDIYCGWNDWYADTQRACMALREHMHFEHGLGVSEDVARAADGDGA